MGNCIERYQQGMAIDGMAGRQIGQTSLSDRYIKDHLGSVQRVIRENGTEENEYIYDSFGNIIYQSGTLSNQRLYTSRYYDSESGLYYYRARYYDSNTGRFISEDPIGFWGGVNLYGYVSNNPVNFKDPTGLTIQSTEGHQNFPKPKPGDPCLVCDFTTVMKCIFKPRRSGLNCIPCLIEVIPIIVGGQPEALLWNPPPSCASCVEVMLQVLECLQENPPCSAGTYDKCMRCQAHTPISLH